MVQANHRLREYARNMRKEPTVSERRIWSWLRGRRFANHKFRRQVPLAGYILDFYSPDLQLAIEIDGSHHEDLDMVAYDGQRARHLRNRGIEVVRIRNEDVARDPRTVADIIRWAVKKASRR